MLPAIVTHSHVALRWGARQALGALGSMTSNTRQQQEPFFRPSTGVPLRGLQTLPRIVEPHSPAYKVSLRGPAWREASARAWSALQAWLARHVRCRKGSSAPRLSLRSSPSNLKWPAEGAGTRPCRDTTHAASCECERRCTRPISVTAQGQPGL